VRHFVVLAGPPDERGFDARVAELRGLGVRPIWDPEGAFGEIGSRLPEIAQRASGFVPAPAPSAAGVPLDVGADAAPNARAELTRELSELAELRYREGGPSDEGPPYPALVDRMTRGELAFFLGADAALGGLPLRRDFYRTLDVLVAGDSELDSERVTQHYLDRYDRGALDAKVDEVLGCWRRSRRRSTDCSPRSRRACGKRDTSRDRR
jgi:hypothetical protein